MKPFFYSFFMLVAGCSAVKQPEIPAVTGFDASRYSGKWYEIARLPNYFEKDLHYVSAEYTLLPDGKLQVVNSGIKKGQTKTISGIARFAGAVDTGNLEVSFFRPFYGAYRIICLAPDYSLACVMGRNRSLVWILARQPILPEKKLSAAVNFLRQNGFSVEKLIYTKQ